MLKLLEIFICSITVLIELIVLLIVGIIIQLIFYKVFNINLYKKISSKLK